MMIAAVALIFATTLTLGYIGVSIIHKFVQLRFEERISFLARYFALSAELGILIDERSLLERMARKLTMEKDIVGVEILNTQGRMLANVRGETGRQTKTIEAPVVLKRTREESLAFEWPARSSVREEIIGKVRITYSTGDIEQLLNTMKSRFVVLAVMIAGVAVLIFYIISRSLVSPLTRLVEAATQVAEGDLQTRVNPTDLRETRTLALAFNAMLDSIEKGQKALDEANRRMIRQNTLAELGKFSLMVAHEVKNPLSIIKSSLDIMKVEVSSESGQVMVSYMEDEIRRLNRLIEDFLLFARPAVPNLRMVDANRMLRETVARMRSSNKGVEILETIPEESCLVSADADLINRAIGNMLKNAFDAGNEKGRVRVIANHCGKEWQVTIEDEGTGIPGENLEKIFEPFFTTRAKGTGLGLAFTAQVVNAHKGRIHAENNPQKGAKFTMVLPCGEYGQTESPGQ